MAIRDWPTDERPREKLLQRGACALSDAELLAIFLRTGVTGKSAVDLARDLIQQFNGLRGLLEAPQTEFCAQKGLGEAKFTQLQAVLEITKRHLAECLRKDTCLNSSKQVQDFLVSTLRHRQREVFAALFLDSQHRLIAYEEIFEGTLASAAVYPREVVKLSLKHNAAAVIFAHNHPSGVAEPSLSDHSITQTLKSALELLDIRTLDHIIIGEGHSYSFAEHGAL